jgi:predicted DNA-binding transcriptional regulator AlpA
MYKAFDPILNEEELAQWLDISRPTLQRQRSDGGGPPFVQLSARRIGYRKSAVEQWLEARTIKRDGALAEHTPSETVPTRGVASWSTANLPPR